MRQQPALHIEQKTTAIAGKATETATGGNDPMTGNNQRKRIGTTGLTNRTRGVVQGFGHLAVGARLMIRNGRDLCPHAALKVRNHGR